MSKYTLLIAIAPPMGRKERAFGLLVPATTTTIWPGFNSLALTVWAARSVLGWNNNNNNKKILTITIGILHFVQEPLIKAASSIKRGSCFEGIRVCFYGLGQPWFIADSETHRKWTTGWQKHTHKHTFNCLLIIIDLESLENCTALIWGHLP